MSESQADTTGGEAEPATSIADVSPPTTEPAAGFFCLDVATKSRPGMIVAAGRLSPQEIALRAAALSGATWVSSEGFWTSEEVG